VTGELQYEQFTDEGLSTVAHGAVICLTIDGNTARIGAMGDKPDQNGVTQFGYMTAIDNGEGANDPPDRASNLVAPTTEARVRLHCQGPSLTQNIFDIQRGNIQVRSGT
jgi:hypothetical protein